jgi:hypothetical protein
MDGTFHFVAKSDLERLEYSSQLMPSDYGSTRSPNELDAVVRLTLADVHWDSGLTRSVSPCWLPQLNGITFGVVQAGKPTVRMVLRVHVDGNTGRPQPRRHSVKVTNAEVDHPDLLGIAKIVRGLGEGADPARPCLLLLRQFIMV